MKRRDFIKLNMYGLTAVTVGSAVGIPGIFQKTHAVAADGLHMSLKEVMHQMVDGRWAYSWAFTDPTGFPSIPGPVIFVDEGDEVSITIENTLKEEHGFAISNDYSSKGAGTLVANATIPGEESREVTFTVPKAGTYIYFDHLNDPVNRVLGLHGMLICRPRDGQHTDGIVTPYSNLPTESQVYKLFRAFEEDELFYLYSIPGMDEPLETLPTVPGHRWDPARTNIWIFSQVDPFKNDEVYDRLQKNLGIDPAFCAYFRENFTPRYFTINGRSGYFSAHDHTMGPDGHHVSDIALIGKVGEPRLIRNMNVGLAVHSPHTHANHCYTLATDGKIHHGMGTITHDNNGVNFIDTWYMRSMECMDLIYPMIKPPDIPHKTWEKLLKNTSEEGAALIDVNPMIKKSGFPLFYPMHCHLELSQTAAGGNYPQGMVTHIEFTGVANDHRVHDPAME